MLSVSGLFIAVALTYTGGLQGTGDTKSPLYISIVSQVVVPLGICFVIQRLGTLEPMHIWIAILLGHATRCVLTRRAVQPGEVAQDRGGHRAGNGLRLARVIACRAPREQPTRSFLGRPARSGYRAPLAAKRRAADLPRTAPRSSAS